MGKENFPWETPRDSGRLLLRGGMVVDPRNGVEEPLDIAAQGGTVTETAPAIPAERGDTVIDCRGLYVFPGLIDMHLHLGDLFEVSTRPAECAAADGVTTGLSPGAGNTFMAPALLGAEVDRGMPLNMGLYLGGAAVLASMLDTDELTALFSGTLDPETAARKMTRNPITNATAPFIVGIKDHMGHFLMPDEKIEQLFQITSRAGLLYMSHTQDPAHARRMADLARGRPLHLAHMTAAGCAADEGAAREAFGEALALCGRPGITGEFVTTMLRRRRGSREGLRIARGAQQMAFDALAAKRVRILISDGQNQSTMKGFGDTRDNLPAIFELSREGVLTLPEAVAAMTCNPAELLASRTGNPWWRDCCGHLGPGACANITVADADAMLAVYTIVNGRVAAFENRLVRGGLGAGRWVSKFGQTRLRVGDLAMYERTDDVSL